MTEIRTCERRYYLKSRLSLISKHLKIGNFSIFSIASSATGTELEIKFLNLSFVEAGSF